MAPRRLAPGTPRLESTPQSRDLLAVVWVYAEGENTEVGWLGSLRQRCRDIGIRINHEGGCGVPRTVAQRAQERQQDIRRARGCMTASDEVWAVFDRDEHPHVDEAISICQACGIGLALSNACFELWPLLHFEDVHANRERSDLQNRLNRQHPTYHHDRGAYVTWEELIPFEQGALNRAVRLHKLVVKRKEGLFDNPFTTAWILQQRLLHARDQEANWFVDLCGRNPELCSLIEYFAEPLRSKVRARFEGR